MNAQTGIPPRLDRLGRARTSILALLACVLQVWAMAAGAAIFVVNSTFDVPAAIPISGVCETAPGNGTCTLRAAIQTANAHPGVDTIILQATTYTLSIPATYPESGADGELEIAESVTITGTGPGSTIIDGNGEVTGARVLVIDYCNPGGNISGTCVNGVVQASISEVTITKGKSSTGLGGGVLNQGSLTLTNTAVTNNSASGFHINDGAGIYNEGSLTLINSTISGNTAIYYDATTPGNGGGVFNSTSAGVSISASMTMTGSTIDGNSAFNGAGLYTFSPLIVINSTISGNAAGGSGGGIYVASGGTKLYNATVADNTDNFGGGSARGGGVAVAAIYAGTSFTFTNSIIANNGYVVPTKPYPTFFDDDCSGTITAVGNSILSTLDMNYCTAIGSPAVVDPIIGPLQYNGGSTRTHALLDGSPAIDGVIGDCADNLGVTLATDQRGDSRPVGAHCDIGAYELQPNLIFENGFQ